MDYSIKKFCLCVRSDRTISSIHFEFYSDGFSIDTLTICRFFGYPSCYKTCNPPPPLRGAFILIDHEFYSLLIWMACANFDCLGESK